MGVLSGVTGGGKVFTFEVEPRFVDPNHGDPLGLRRSQRAVVDHVMLSVGGSWTARIVAFHAPTGAGKSHLLRTLVQINRGLEKPRKMIFTFPVHALVDQQSGAIGADKVDPESAMAALREDALRDPKGEAAEIVRAYEETWTIPPSLRRGALVRDLLAGEVTTPVALTPDALDLAVRGVVAGTIRLKGGEGALERVRRIARNFFRGLLPREEARRGALAVVAAVEPRRLGKGVERKVRRLIRTRLSPLNRALPDGVNAEDIARVARRISEQVEPLDRDVAPGPKYAFSKETAEQFKQVLDGALVVFDEYHLVAKYPANFRRLISRLRRMGASILVMSGTPRVDFLQAAAGARGDVVCLEFDEFEAVDPGTKTTLLQAFNHPLRVEIRRENFQAGEYDFIEPLVEAVETWDEQAPGPMVAIFESRRRALMAKEALRAQYGKRVFWWTGPEKCPEMAAILRGKRKSLPSDAIVIGTSAMELGVDLPFRNGWIECCYHDEMMQRIGRVGRQGTRSPGEVHNIVLITRSALGAPHHFNPGEDGKPRFRVARVDLSQALLDFMGLQEHRADYLRESLWFRGERRAQCLALVPDGDGFKAVRGPVEEMLKIYPVHRPLHDRWAALSMAEKRQAMLGQHVDRESARKAAWGENFHPASIAYVARNMDFVRGGIEGPEVLSENKRGLVLVRWTRKGHEVLRAMVPASSVRRSRGSDVPEAPAPAEAPLRSLNKGIVPKAKRGIRMLGAGVGNEGKGE